MEKTKKISGWFELMVTIIIGVVIYFSGWIVLPTICSVSSDEDFKNVIIEELFKQYEKSAPAYLIIALIVGIVISYFIYAIIAKEVEKKAGNSYTEKGIQKEFDTFLIDAYELYILGGDIDFLLTCSSQLEKIKKLGSKCSILCGQYENHDKKDELKKLYKDLNDKKVCIRRYDKDSDKFDNLRGQIKKHSDGTYECLLVKKQDKKGMFEMVNLDNQFIISELIKTFESMYLDSKNPVVSLILFDMGGVYFDGDCTEDFINVINKEFSIKIKTSREHKLVLDRDLNLGKKTITQWVEEQAPNHEFTEKERQRIKEVWTNVWSPNKKMKDLVEKLSENKYKVGILSNMDKLNGGVYNEKGFFDIFPIENRFLSFEYSMLKPDVNFFKEIFTKLSLEPYEILFIDDHEDNIKVAQELGIETIQFSLKTDSSLSTLEKKLESYTIKY